GHSAVRVEEDQDAEGAGEGEGTLVEAEVEVTEAREDRQEAGEPGRFVLDIHRRGGRDGRGRRRRRRRGRRGRRRRGGLFHFCCSSCRGSLPPPRWILSSALFP